MARSKLNSGNIDNSSPAVYLQGRVKDNAGAGDGTPVNEFVYGDLHQTLAKLMALYNISYNGLPDNETNGYQLVEALRALASKNDFVLPLTSTNGVLQIPIKIGALGINESFICKAAINKSTESSVKGTLDNVTKTATFLEDFKTNDYVRVVNLEGSVLFIRMVDAFNADAIVAGLEYLKKASQSQENTGSADTVATTPKVNKVTFTRRVNGVDSGAYLATAANNGLFSKEDKTILDNIGGARIRNTGFISGIDVDSGNVNDPYSVGGDINSAVIQERTQNGNVIRAILKNAMSNTNYKLQISVESNGNIEQDNDIKPVVWRIISATEVRIYVEENESVVQNLKIHIEAIQL